MIVILSKDKYELTTEDVMDWLSFFETPYTRINGEDLLKNNYVIEINETDGVVASPPFDLFKSDVTVWFRRWYEIEYDEEYLRQFNSLSFKQGLSLHTHLRREIKRISDFCWDFIPEQKIIDHPKFVDLNKIKVLQKAIECGLHIPPTIISTSSNDIKDFIKINGRVIAKPISELLFFEYANYSFMTLTKEVKIEDVDKNLYFPTLFQKLIPKDYEIRIFVLDEEIYSMAIFSQNDEKTKVDFRKYNLKKMNRYVPYNLPSDISKNILKLMKQVNLKCGSIDMMKSVDGDFYFLEINPIGQLGMVSKSCNFPLEKLIAQRLMKVQNVKTF